MEMTKFNLNSDILVNLFPDGIRAIPLSMWEMIRETKINIEGKDYYKMQGWELFVYFGKHYQLGNPYPLFNLDIIIPNLIS